MVTAFRSRRSDTGAQYRSTVIDQGLTNHFFLALDASSSMDPHRTTVPLVVERLIARWAEDSKKWDQETRVSVYTFASAGQTRLLVWDKDVLRLPSIREHYAPNGYTALVECTHRMLDDAALIPQRYGDHAFLFAHITDGEENESTALLRRRLPDRIKNAPDNQTFVVLVPDTTGYSRARSVQQTAAYEEATKWGYPGDLIQMWDTSTAAGVEKAGETIYGATETFFAGRAQGVRGYRSGGLFTPDTANLNVSTVANAMEALVPGRDYQAFVVDGPHWQIEAFVAHHTGQYVKGTAFYELAKTVEVQDYKKVLFQDRLTGTVYAGPNGRKLLGLPDYKVSIAPAAHPQYKIFFQSKSTNRKLIAGTTLIVLANP